MNDRLLQILTPQFRNLKLPMLWQQVLHSCSNCVLWSNAVKLVDVMRPIMVIVVEHMSPIMVMVVHNMRPICVMVVNNTRRIIVIVEDNIRPIFVNGGN